MWHGPILGLRAMYFLLAAVAKKVSPAQLRAGGDPGVYWYQDVPDQHLQDPGSRVVGRRSWHFGVDNATEGAQFQSLAGGLRDF
jgi:hypothetical protein